MRGLLRLLGVIVVVSMVVSCGLAVSFDDYGVRAHRPEAGASDGALVDGPLVEPLEDAGTVTDAPVEPREAGPPPVLYDVSGFVTGLDGATVRLGLGAKEILAPDGPFTFFFAVAAGAPFHVDVLAQPAGRVCHVELGTGVIIGPGDTMATGVLVKCEPAVAQLASVCIPAAEPGMPCVGPNTTLFPAFSSAVLSYAVILRSDMFYFAVSATAVQLGSTVKITGPNLAGNGYFYPSQGPNLVTIDVTAPDGVTHGIYQFNAIVDGIHYVKASNGRAGAAFGAAVALDGDTLVVAAPGESSNAVGVGGVQGDTSQPGAGAVYVFSRSATSTGFVWSQTGYLKPSNTRAGARFGSSVLLSGTTLVVASDAESSGASGINGNDDDSSAPGAGAVYVFELAGGSWSQTAYIKASNAKTDARFGTAIALFGSTIAVGAPGESSAAVGINGDQTSVAAANAGAAYVFTRTAAVWSQKAYVKASNARAGARFGTAIGLNATRLGVGAPGDSSASSGLDGSQSAGGAEGTGAAYVFLSSGATWSQELFVKADLLPQANGGFASSLAVTTTGDVAIGWPVIDAVASVRYYAGVGWRSYVTYAVPHPATGHAASVVCASGDFDRYLLLLGSPFEAGGGSVTIAGEAVPPTNLVTPPGAAPKPVKAPNARENALFGAAIGFSRNTLAVGSPGESSNATTVDGNQADTSAPMTGAVYVY